MASHQAFLISFEGGGEDLRILIYEWVLEPRWNLTRRGLQRSIMWHVSTINQDTPEDRPGRKNLGFSEYESRITYYWV
jgi:hypothetical protein